MLERVRGEKRRRRWRKKLGVVWCEKIVKYQAQQSISSIILRIYCCCWYANFGHVNLQREEPEEEEEVGPISFVDSICSSERRRELWCKECREEWREERKEGSWGPLFFSDTISFVYSTWVPLENLFWYWKLAPIGYYLEKAAKFLAVNMERLVSHRHKLQFSPSSHYHRFFLHLQGQYPSLGKLQTKKLPLPLHPSYKCYPVLSFCSTSTTITTPTTVAAGASPARLHLRSELYE